MKIRNKAFGVITCMLIAFLYIVILKALGYAEYKLFHSSEYYSLSGVLVQCLATAVIFIPLILYKKINVLKRMRVSIWRGLGVAGFYTFCMLLLVYTAFQQVVVNYALGKSFLPVYKILLFALSMILVGLSEELLFRGVIYNVLSDFFGRDTRKGVILTVLWSGFIFGSVHITNYFSGVSLSGAYFQSVAAIGIGCYFGAIYARTDNLWVLVILHALNDMALDVEGGLFGIGTIADSVSAYGPTTYITLILYLGLAMFLLRKKKSNEYISESYGQE